MKASDAKAISDAYNQRKGSLDQLLKTIESNINAQASEGRYGALITFASIFPQGDMDYIAANLIADGFGLQKKEDGKSIEITWS